MQEERVQEESLKRTLGVTSIVFSVLAWAAPLLVVAGQMPTMIAYSQNGIVIGYLVPMLSVLFFSVGYVAITRYVDRPGAFYAYITAGLGRIPGLGGAFVAVFGYAILLISTWLCFGVQLRQLISLFHGPEIPWYLCALLGVAISAILSSFSVNLSAKVLIALMSCEALLIIIFDVAVAADGGPTGFATSPFSIEEGIMCNNFGLAVLFGTLCFIGFESSTIYREEAKDPEKTVARATYISVIIIGIFYLISSFMMLTALGTDGVMNLGLDKASTLFMELTTSYVAKIVADIAQVLLVTSTFAALLAQHNAVTRYCYSFGKDGVLPGKFAKVHPRFGSPYMSSIFVTVLEVLFVIAITAGTGFDSAGETAYVLYMRINGLGAITIIFLMCLVSIAILVFFRKHKDGGISPWKVLISPVIGLVGLAFLLILAIGEADMLIGLSKGVSIALTIFIPIVFLCGCLYARKLKYKNKDIYDRIGRQS